jgi:hypothetical protein
MTDQTNPFKISIGRNDQMGCFELQLSVGNLKDRKEAEAFADILRDWMIEDSKTAWVRRVQ